MSYPYYRILWFCCFGAAFSALSAQTQSTATSLFTAGDVIYSTPALDRAGNLYFGSRDGFVYSLQADGTERWRFPTGDWVEASPVISNAQDTVYVGSWDGHFYAIDAQTGAENWRIEGELGVDYVIGAAALDLDGNVYFGRSDGTLTAVSPEGEVLWEHFAASSIDSSPVFGHNNVGQPRLFFASGAGTVHALNAEDGTEVWSAAFIAEDTEDPRIYAAPALYDNRLYIGSGTGELKAFDMTSGAVIWTYQAEGIIDSSVAINPTENALYFLSWDGYLRALDLNGNLLWDYAVGLTLTSSPVIDRNGLIYVTSFAGSGTSRTWCFDPEGTVLWYGDLPDYVDASMVLDHNQRLLVGCYDGQLYAYEAKARLATEGWPKLLHDHRNSGSSLALLDPAAYQFFLSASEAGETDWLISDWYGWVYVPHFPWLYSYTHGWNFVLGEHDGSVWIYDMHIGWLYTSSYYGGIFFFNAQTGHWLQYLYGDYVNGRAYYDSDAMQQIAL